MKFIEGMLIGSLVTVGATLMYTNVIPKSDTKKMMKKTVNKMSDIVDAISSFI